jgi:glyceraldehyde 3-phosphate dehydrogenase
MKVAINGMGRIGRAAFKILIDTPELELTAVNDLIPADNLAYLLNYDTVYGRYPKKVRARSDALIVEGTSYRLLNKRDPATLPWGELGIEIVFDCTGQFDTREALSKHIETGAKTVILSAPSKSEEIPTIIYGVNEAPRNGAARIISCASCTTNCITPVMEILGRRIGVQKAIMATTHAYTSSQLLVDGPNKKMRRGRAAGANLVPSTTGAAVATTRALPEYTGKFHGTAVRAPIPVGSLADIVLLTKRDTTVEEINAIFIEEAAGERYRGIVGITEDPIVSSDIIQDCRASIVDLGMTQVVDGNLAKVMSWYDNEWGYASQMIRTAVSLKKEARSEANVV